MLNIKKLMPIMFRGLAQSPVGAGTSLSFPVTSVVAVSEYDLYLVWFLLYPELGTNTGNQYVDRDVTANSHVQRVWHEGKHVST